MEESSTQASTPSKKPLSKEQLLKYIKQLKAQNKKLEDEIEGLKASGAPDEKRVASLEEVLASKQRQLEDEQAKNEQITKELLKTDTNFQESLAKIQELQGGFEMMREKLEGQVMALTSELASAKNINSELERKGLARAKHRRRCHRRSPPRTAHAELPSSLSPSPLPLPLCKPLVLSFHRRIPRATESY